jgi:putative membrane protein
MIRDAVNGFFMAMADSVPGVSGGTVAFILGFYDKFIGSINGLVFGPKKERKEGFRYLIRLAIGWVIGMAMAVVALNALFEQHIYAVSSLFIGFIVGAIPVVMSEEKDSVRAFKKGLPFLFIGGAIVVAVTYLNAHIGTSALDLADFSAGIGIRLFFSGMAAVSAMFLPGISGSTILLVLGAYMPVMTALRGLLSMETAYVPALLCFILGILAGAASVVKLIQYGLEHYRPQMIYLILGMMIASLYSVVMGPTTLSAANAPLSLASFNIIACLVGVAFIVLLQLYKKHLAAAEKAQA